MAIDSFTLWKCYLAECSEKSDSHLLSFQDVILNAETIFSVLMA